jgi:hypothetical protein
MPGIVPLASVDPVYVLPRSLSKAFTASRSYDSLVNTYANGESQREILVTNSRRRWKLTKRLTPAALVELRDFWDTHRTDPFYFYDPHADYANETVIPIGSNWDASGASQVGRFAVRFEGDWSQSMGVGRGEASIELVELAESFSGAATLNFSETAPSAHVVTAGLF